MSPTHPDWNETGRIYQNLALQNAAAERMDFPARRFPLDETRDRIAIFARMESSKNLSPNPTELIDWLNGEGLLELDWDFPEDGDLFAAGLDSMAVMQLVVAVEDEYGVELTPDDLTRANLATPITLAKLIAEKSS
jgi:acyl carrier protein